MSKFKRQVLSHNENMRKVKHVYSYSYSKFLNQSSGNLLINGGLKEKRRQLLLETIVDLRNNSKETVVIFSDDYELQRQLIELAKQDEIGQLFVCSEEFPNYDFFFGMRNNFISEYFNRIALERGARDTTELNSYVDSFISILSSQAPVNLTAMRHFARNTDSGIASVSSEPFEAEMILSSTKGGVSFRSLLNNTYNAFSSLTLPTCETKLSLKTLVGSDSVILINIPADYSEFFSLYFAMELKGIMNQNYTCIFDDSIMLNNDVMRSTIETMKQRQQITVIVSHENIVAVGESDDIIKNFNRNVILLNGNTPDVDLQKVLSEFGHYTHMDAMETKNRPANEILTFIRGRTETPMSYQRERVIIQEENGNEVLLKGGSSSEIIIAKTLLI